MTFALAFPSNQKSTNYDMILINTTANICQKGVVGNFLMKNFMENRNKYSNMNFTCPFPAGNYSYKNSPLLQYDMPLVLPDTKFRMSFILKALIQGGQKKFMEAYSSEIFGEYFRGSF